VFCPNLNGRVYTKPREKSGRVSLVPEDIHDRQLYILSKIRAIRNANEPTASTDHRYMKTSQVLVRRQRLHSKIRKDVVNVLTTNLQSKILGLGIKVIQKCYVS
jgi:hypothetical protein